MRFAIDRDVFAAAVGAIVVAACALAAVPGFAQLSADDAVTRVVANSASVAGAQATVRQRQSELRLARLGGIPHLTGDYSLSPQAAPTGSATVEQHFVTIGAGISINDLLATAGATRVAAADLLSAERDADSARLQARETAIRLYFAALEAIAIESVRADALRGAERSRTAAEIRSLAGEAPRLDVLRAGVTVAQAQADLVQAQADRANAVDALASAAAVDASTLIHMQRTAQAGTAAGAGSSPAPVLDERRAVARALASRPELAALLASIDARAASVGLARSSGWPTTTVAGGYQRGVDTAIPVQGPQAAVHVDLAIAPGTSDRVAIAQAQVDAARAQLLEQRRTIALDVAAAVRSARADQTAERAADRARDQARRALAAVELGYREGASSSLDVAEAQRTSVQTSVDALVARYRTAQAFAILQAIAP
jgi:outer membrane protein TolC